MKKNKVDVVPIKATESAVKKPTDAVAVDMPAETVAADKPADEVAVDMSAEAVTADKPTDAVVVNMPAEAVAADKPADAVVVDMPAEAVTVEKPIEVVIAVEMSAEMIQVERRGNWKDSLAKFFAWPHNIIKKDRGRRQKTGKPFYNGVSPV